MVRDASHENMELRAKWNVVNASWASTLKTRFDGAVDLLLGINGAGMFQMILRHHITYSRTRRWRKFQK